jgi:hypothetical protein
LTNKGKNINNVTEEMTVKRKQSNQEKADDLILNYICAHGKPFTTVEEPKFKKLISGLSKLKLEAKCMRRKSLVMKMRTK